MLRRRAGASGTIKRRMKSGVATRIWRRTRLAKQYREWRKPLDTDGAKIIAGLRANLGQRFEHLRSMADSLSGAQGACLLLPHLAGTLDLCVRRRTSGWAKGGLSMRGNTCDPRGIGARLRHHPGRTGTFIGT